MTENKPRLQARSPLNSRHVPALDGLRAVAVLAVILLHLSYRRFPGGRIGVDIFFVLSGYLITSLLVREADAVGKIDLRAFYMRRFFRLMPALVLVLACEAIFFLLFGGPSPHEWSDLLFALTYLTDFQVSLSDVNWVSSVMHTWSLAVEEHFYIVWPIVLIAILKLQRRWQIAAVLAVFAALVAWRSYMVFTGVAAQRTEFAFDTRVDPMLLGCALALWLNGDPAPALVNFLRKLWPAAALALVVVFLKDENAALWMRSLGWAATAVLITITLVELVTVPSGILARALSTWPMTYLGKISYGVYLWHWPILIQMRYRNESAVAAEICIICAVIAAAASFRFVETPFLRLKRRFERQEGREAQNVSDPGPRVGGQVVPARSPAYNVNWKSRMPPAGLGHVAGFGPKKSA